MRKVENHRIREFKKSGSSGSAQALGVYLQGRDLCGESAHHLMVRSLLLSFLLHPGLREAPIDQNVAEERLGTHSV